MAMDFVDVWQGCINQESDDYSRAWSVLDTAEQAQAHKITSAVRHKEYVQIHAQLRYTLANTIQQAPEKIVINKTATGKPYLADYPDLVFNISHTTDLFLIAIAKNCQLGIDVEQRRSRLNLNGLVSKCFSEEEQTYWRQLADAEQLSTFYKYWTRKEAFVKATGQGIVLGLNQCVIDANNINQFLSIPKQCTAVNDWFVYDLDVGEQHFAALVTDQARFAVRQFRLV